MASQIPITVRAPPAAASSPAVRGKKRPASPAVCAAQQVTGSCSSKKKKVQLTAVPAAQAQITAVELVPEVKPVGTVDCGPAAITESTAKPPPFKDPTFMVNVCFQLGFSCICFCGFSLKFFPRFFLSESRQHSGIGGAAAGKKNRTWKNLKQILALERTLPWTLNDPNYYSIDAPPSLKPAKKYSDISGLPANYTDPQTKLRFTSSEEFSYIRLLPTDVVTGYLALRKETCIVP
ncbi:INO80 complex subunit C isoform X1 [Anarrhichthys ocellatus]|uniref:INO80 complex subunit C-like isoform X1 n=1 Tax=Anarrhichthys ocellatus TaxID=433405 RepID=UPI0012EDB641|nr:INO80 complex subunit C-like isoform X1 [Anarrhichthys ocellatus]XP_031708733.1 INO80 complex subunit C-like isoform X1 [Anarrhichthys ocellatus]